MSTEAEYKPGLEDVPVAESAVSFIDGKRARLEYRGIAVEMLARESCFEETAWLLLKGELPTQKQLADFDDGLRQRRGIKYKLNDLIKCLPEPAIRWTPCKRPSPRWACSTRAERSQRAEELGRVDPPDRQAADRRGGVPPPRATATRSSNRATTSTTPPISITC